MALLNLAPVSRIGFVEFYSFLLCMYICYLIFYLRFSFKQCSTSLIIILFCAAVCLIYWTSISSTMLQTWSPLSWWVKIMIYPKITAAGQQQSRPNLFVNLLYVGPSTSSVTSQPLLSPSWLLDVQLSSADQKLKFCFVVWSVHFTASSCLRTTKQTSSHLVTIAASCWAWLFQLDTATSGPVCFKYYTICELQYLITQSVIHVHICSFCTLI